MLKITTNFLTRLSLVILVLNFQSNLVAQTTTPDHNAIKLMKMITKTRIKYYESKNKINPKPEERLIKEVALFLSKNKVNFEYVCPKDCGALTYGASTVLTIAVMTKSIKLIKLLLDHGANINFHTKEVDAPILHLSQFHGFNDMSNWGDKALSSEVSYLETALFLLDNGADPGIFSNKNDLKVHISDYWRKIKGNETQHTTKDLAQINFLTTWLIYYSSFNVRCDYEDVKFYKPLLSHPKMKLNQQNDLGMTALHVAFYKHACAYGITRVLVESGADKKIKDNLGYTPAEYFPLIKDHRALQQNAYDYLMSDEE